MSKAFTRDDDGVPDLPLPARPVATLPPGAPNYLTPDGAQRLREQLAALIERRRGSASADPEARRRLAPLDAQILRLQQSLDSASIVQPPPEPWTDVRVGANVKVRDQHGEEFAYRIVGVDETDLTRDWVSWCSPVARALLNARLGQRVRVQAPAGDLELEILDITYAPPQPA